MEEILVRIWSDLGGRIGGPLSFRLVLQPVVAIVIAVRAGLADARNGRPPYFSTMVFDPAQRLTLLREGWRAVAKVFILAIVIDVAYQVMVFGWVYPVETVLVAIILALVPYLLARGIVTRIAVGLHKSNDKTDRSRS